MKWSAFETEGRDGAGRTGRQPKSTGFTIAGMAVAVSLVCSAGVGAQIVAPKVKIYRTDSFTYPFVQVHFRTLDQNRSPFVNLNYMNVGIMVQGKSYDPNKRQYGVQTIENAGQPVRAVVVLDASRSIDNRGFAQASEAATSFIAGKRPRDQVAILAISDTEAGFTTVSDFERDAGVLTRRLGQVQQKAEATRLYDTVGAAMQMCAAAGQGGATTDEAEYIPSCAVLVFGSGGDTGSAAYREELIGRIGQMPIPIPIYSFSVPCDAASTEVNNVRNLQSMSNNSFGKYYAKCEVDDVHHVMRNDYVLTFRSYLPVDGAGHPIKLGIEYPAGTGKIISDTAQFEANQSLPVDVVQKKIQEASAKIPALPDGNPYTDSGDAGKAPSKGKTWMERINPFAEGE